MPAQKLIKLFQGERIYEKEENETQDNKTKNNGTLTSTGKNCEQEHGEKKKTAPAQVNLAKRLVVVMSSKTERMKDENKCCGAVLCSKTSEARHC